MAKFLRIALWNANGLISHKNELTIFLSLNKIDILLVSETHLTKFSHFSVPFYSVYHSPHPDGTAHGGTAVIVKSSISHYEMNHFNTNYIQSTSVKVKAFPYDLTFTAVYCPPRHNIKREHFQEFFDTLGTRFLAGGDFNSKHPNWGSRLVNPKGKELNYVIQQNNYASHSTGTPCWPSDPAKIPYLLRFFICSGIDYKCIEVQPNHHLTSDHSTISSLNSMVMPSSSNSKLHNSRTNWDKY